MAESLGEAVLELRTDSSKLNSGLASAKRSTEGLGGSFSKLNKNASASIREIRASTFLLTGAIVGLAAALGEAIKKSAEQERVVALVEAGVRKSAVTFGLTSQAIQDYAAELQKSTKFADEEILAGSAILLSFHRIQGDAFKRVTALALDMSTVLGTDLKSQIIQLGKALEDPVTQMTYLSRSGTTFTQVQKDVVKQMVATNHLAEAQAYILDEVEKQYGGAAHAARDTMGGALVALKNEWGDLLETIGSDVSDGAMRSAVEGLVNGLRDLKELLPQFTVAWNEMLADILSSDADFSAAFALWVLGLLRAVEKIPHGIPILGQFADDAGKAADAIENNLTNAMIGVQAQVDEFRKKSQDALDKWVKGPKTISAAQKKAAADAAAAAVKAAEEAAKAAAEHAKAIQGIIDKYDPLGAKVRELESDWKNLQEAISSGALKGDAAQRALEDFGKQLDGMKESVPQFTLDILDNADAFDELARRMDEIGPIPAGPPAPPKDLADKYAEIQKGFQQAIGQSLHDAATGFLSEMESGLTDGLSGPLKSFADALLSAANEWLVAMLANIVKTKLAAKGIGAAEGSSGTGDTGSYALAAKGLGAVGWALVAAVAVAAVSNYINKRHEAGRFDSGTGMGFNSGQGTFWSESFSGFHRGDEIIAALKSFWQNFTATTGTWVDGLGRLSVEIRHDQGAFKVILDGVVQGTFHSMNEAIIAAIRTQFASAKLKGEVDPAIASLVAHYTGSDPAALNSAVAALQDMIDTAKGLTDIEKTIRGILPAAQDMISSLRTMGVSMADVTRIVGGDVLAQFRNAWQQLSGAQMTPEQQRAQAERQRALLLAQLNLYKVELQAREAYIKSGAAMVKSGVEVDRAKVRSDADYLKTEGRLMGAEGELWNNYLDGRAQFVDAQNEIFTAELKAIDEILKQVDVMIEQVKIGKINIPNIGGGHAGRGGGGESLQSKVQSLIDAMMSDISSQEDLIREMHDAFSGLKDFLGNLRLTGPTSLTPGQQILELQKKLQLAAKRAMGGDLGAVQEFQDIANQLKDLGAQAFGTSTAGFDALLRMIESLGTGVLDQGNTIMETEVDHLHAMRESLADMLEAAHGLHDLTQAQIAAIRKGDTNALTSARDIIQEFANLRAQSGRDQSELRALLIQLGRIIAEAAA